MPSLKKLLWKELLRRAFEEIAHMLLQEEKQRWDFWVLTDDVLLGEDVFRDRCARYDRMARAKGFPTLESHVLMMEEPS